jgi:hypothetical protein
MLLEDGGGGVGGGVGVDDDTQQAIDNGGGGGVDLESEKVIISLSCRGLPSGTSVGVVVADGGANGADGNRDGGGGGDGGDGDGGGGGGGVNSVIALHVRDGDSDGYLYAGQTECVRSTTKPVFERQFVSR